MSHTVENRKPLLNRIRRIQGQLASLEKALDGGAECGDVLQQVAAIRGAANGLLSQVLEGHLRTHMVPASGEEDDVEEIVKVLRSYLT